MSNHAFIGQVQKDGSVKYVELQYDGYLNHAGVILSKFYADPKKVEKLISMGDITVLARDIGEKHDPKWKSRVLARNRNSYEMAFNDPDYKKYMVMCIFAVRDYGRYGKNTKFVPSVEAFRNLSATNLYVYDGSWKFYENEKSLGRSLENSVRKVPAKIRERALNG